MTAVSDLAGWLDGLEHQMGWAVVETFDLVLNKGKKLHKAVCQFFPDYAVCNIWKGDV